LTQKARLFPARGIRIRAAAANVDIAATVPIEICETHCNRASPVYNTRKIVGEFLQTAAFPTTGGHMDVGGEALHLRNDQARQGLVLVGGKT